MFGVAGDVLRKLGFSITPMVIAMVLSFLVETNLRRALVLSDGSSLIFLARPLSVVFLLLGVIPFFYPIVAGWREPRRRDPRPRLG